MAEIWVMWNYGRPFDLQTDHVFFSYFFPHTHKWHEWRWAWLMADPKGQLYVYDIYAWPKGPAIIPHDSYLAQRVSLQKVLPWNKTNSKLTIVTMDLTATRTRRICNLPLLLQVQKLNKTLCGHDAFVIYHYYYKYKNLKKMQSLHSANQKQHFLGQKFLLSFLNCGVCWL